MNALEAAGACNPDFQPVVATATGSADAEPAEAEPPGAQPGFAHQTAVALRQVMDALAKVRRGGCHDASLTLTRPTPMIEGMEAALRDAGIRHDVVRMSGGCSRLILWS